MRALSPFVRLVNKHASNAKLTSTGSILTITLLSTEILFLSSNEFTGPIPTTIGRPAGFAGSLLRGLYLSENKFVGTIPENLCNFTKLEALFVDDNQLIGTIPACIGKLTDLVQLYAFKNQLTGEVPVELSSLRKLSKFRER